jgi:hypothetical protein
MSDNQDRMMRHPEPRRVLNRLLAIERYSLANYLLYARPWTHPGDEPLLEALRRITTDQQAAVVRIGRLLVRRYGYAESGQFPLEFTAYDDVALDYLVQRLIEHERRMIDDVARCAEQLAGDPEARQLAEEVLGSERRHLALLCGLEQSQASGEPSRALAGQRA